MMLPYKIVHNNKRVVHLVSVQCYFHTSLLWPVYYDNWRCYLKNNKKMMHLISSLAQFSLIVSFCVISSKNSGLSRNFFKFYIYIYIIEIRNIETYLPEWVFLPQWFGCKFTPKPLIRKTCYHAFAKDSILTNIWLKKCWRSDGVNYNTFKVSSFYFSYPLKYVFFN